MGNFVYGQSIEEIIFVLIRLLKTGVLYQLNSLTISYINSVLLLIIYVIVFFIEKFILFYDA